MQIPHGHVPPPYEPNAADRLFDVWKDFAASQNYPGGTDEYTTPYQEAALQRFFPAAAHILFLGCGNGREVVSAQALGHDAWGITLNENNLRFARETLGLKNVYLMDGHLLPLDWKGRFDGVLGFQYMEHSPAPVLQLVEVLRVLKPGGLAYFETPGPYGWTLNENLHHLTCPINVQASGWLLKAGFTGIDVETLGNEESARHIAFFGRKPNV